MRRFFRNSARGRYAPIKNQRHHARHLLGLIRTFAGLMCAIALMIVPTRVATAQTVYPSWSFTGNLSTARRLYTATLLQNGKVLVAGGVNNMDGSCNSGNCFKLNTAEFYDPATGTWTSTGNLNVARY